MGNKAHKNLSSNNQDHQYTNTKNTAKQVELHQKSNYIAQLLVFGYINEVFGDLQNNNSVITSLIPNDIYQLCLSMYGLTQHRHIFLIENLSNNTCILKHRNKIDDAPIRCSLEKKELLTNSSYKICKSMYINNLKHRDYYVDVIVLCGAENHYVSPQKINYYASMITIQDCQRHKQSNIIATCSVLPWCSYWNPKECSNLTYDQHYGLMIAIYNARRNNHSIYHLKLLDEYAEWKQLIVLNGFKYAHVFIQMVHKNNTRYLFVSDRGKTTKLYDLCKAHWISAKSNDMELHTTSKICYDNTNNRIYFIDISYCCYFDVNTYEWILIAAPGYFSTEKDVIYIKHCIDRKDVMILGRNYYFTYNIHTNQWKHRYTLDRDVQHESHDSFILI